MPSWIRRAASRIASTLSPVSRATRSSSNPRTWSANSVEAGRVGVDEREVDPAVADQHVRQPVQEHQVGLGPHRQVQRGRHRGLGPARIDDDDLGLLAVAHHPLPEDRVGDADVRPDEDDAVRLLEVLVGVRRGVESERLLVGRDGRGHALAGVAVAVDHPHAELGHGAQQGHLLGGDLAGAQEGDGVVAVGRLDLPEPRRHGRQRRRASRPAAAGRRRPSGAAPWRGRGHRGRSGPPSPWGRPGRG